MVFYQTLTTFPRVLLAFENTKSSSMYYIPYKNTKNI